MDLNWCQYCERSLEPVDSADEYDSSDYESSKLTSPPKTTSGNAGLHRKHSSKSKIHVKRTHSSGKLASTKRLAAMTASQPAPKQIHSWSGLYCSEDCMQKDEQKSRLAIANLQQATSQDRIVPAPSSSSSHSTQSDEYNPYIGSSSSKYNAARSYDPFHRPAPLNLVSSRRNSSTDRGSSDSLASQNSPRQYSPALPVMSSRGSSRNFLRPMTPIHSTFLEETETVPQIPHHRISSLNGSPVRPPALRSNSDNPPSLSYKQTAQNHPLATSVNVFDAQEDRSDRSRKISLTASRKGLMPSLGKSSAPTFLSHGEEGLAMATLISPSQQPDWSEWNFTPQPPQPQQQKHRSRTSASSIPHLSCSPSSPDSSSPSTCSNRSVASTAPTEAQQQHKGSPSTTQEFLENRRSHSSAHLCEQPSLQHYKLYTSRPTRAPSSTALSSIGKSPPARPPIHVSQSFGDSSGTISRIFQARAQQHRAASKDRSQKESVPWPSALPVDANGLQAHHRTPSYGNIRRTGSSASVTSLPHYFAEAATLQPKPGQAMTRSHSRHSSSGEAADPDTALSSSASKGWSWTNTNLQYRAMEVATNSATPKDSKKRLFYFNETTTH